MNQSSLLYIYTFQIKSILKTILLIKNISVLLFRVPLNKGKSIRQNMREAGVLDEYLQSHKIDMSDKYKGYAVASESMYFDVSLQKK